MSTYPLHSQRLLIEPMTDSEIDAFLAYRRNPDVARWQSWSAEYDRAEADALLSAQPTGDLPSAGEWMQLAVRSSSTGQLYGDIAIGRSADQPGTFEIGATFDPNHQGLGMATEAADRVVEFLFKEAGAHRVTAYCDTRNSGAQGVLRRIGLRHESHQVAAEYLKGEWTTVDGYALLAKEYVARAAGAS